MPYTESQNSQGSPVLITTTALYPAPANLGLFMAGYPAGLSQLSPTLVANILSGPAFAPQASANTGAPLNLSNPPMPLTGTLTPVPAVPAHSPILPLATAATPLLYSQQLGNLYTPPSTVTDTSPALGGNPGSSASTQPSSP